MKSNNYIEELKKHIGEKRDYFQIIDVVQNGKKSRLVVKCVCGNTREMTLSQFNNKSVHSCGCVGAKKGKHSPNFKHGLSRTRIYGVYRDMWNRCYNKDDISYPNYGEKGIFICEEWLGNDGPVLFSKWAYENGYDELAKRGDCTVDRIDVMKEYSPDNCRLVSMKIQNNNKNNNRVFEIDGEYKTLSEWCRYYNIECVQTVWGRIQRGMDVKTALTKPMKKRLSEMTELELEERRLHRKEMDRKWREEHKEQIQKSRRKWIENNPEKNRESKRKYEEKKKEKKV